MLNEKGNQEYPIYVHMSGGAFIGVTTQDKILVKKRVILIDDDPDNLMYRITLRSPTGMGQADYSIGDSIVGEDTLGVEKCELIEKAIDNVQVIANNYLARETTIAAPRRDWYRVLRAPIIGDGGTV